MSLTEQKRKNDALLDVEKRFEAKYAAKKFGSNRCFVTSSGTIFRPFGFPGDNALAIEYADTPEDAEKNLFEDGDRFYLSELVGDKLFQAMVSEIEE